MTRQAVIRRRSEMRNTVGGSCSVGEYARENCTSKFQTVRLICVTRAAEPLVFLDIFDTVPHNTGGWRRGEGGALGLARLGTAGLPGPGRAGAPTGRQTSGRAGGVREGARTAHRLALFTERIRECDEEREECLLAWPDAATAALDLALAWALGRRREAAGWVQAAGRPQWQGRPSLQPYLRVARSISNFRASSDIMSAYDRVRQSFTPAMLRLDTLGPTGIGGPSAGGSQEGDAIRVSSLPGPMIVVRRQSALAPSEAVGAVAWVQQHSRPRRPASRSPELEAGQDIAPCGPRPAPGGQARPIPWPCAGRGPRRPRRERRH